MSAKGHICRIVGLCMLVVFVLPVQAQFETEPHPLDTFLKSVLDFREPTGIRGTVRYWDQEEQVLWIDWESRSDDRPLFTTGWMNVPGDPTLAVHPSEPELLQAFPRMPKGTAIEMVVQLDPEGKRRILSFVDLTHPRKVPL